MRLNAPDMALCASISALAASHAATIVQTFEPGEDTSNWNSTWTGGVLAPGFLDPSIGGVNAGSGGSSTQSFSRDFRNNTAGLDITEAYSIAMDVRIGAFDGPSGGQFEIVDGSFGSGNAANLRIFTEDLGGGNFTYHWQARDNSSGWQDLGINMDLASPYRIELGINPENFTYTAVVHLTDGAGNILDSGSLSGLAFDQNVIGNGQNGSLLFYIQASSGGTQALVDNINIQTIPEPSALLIAGISAPWLLVRRRRRKRLEEK